MNKTILYISTILTFLISTLCVSLSAQTTFQGNGNTGFASGLGDGTLSISDAGADVTMTFNAGTSGTFNNNVVIYIDNNIDAGRNVIDSDVNDTADVGRTVVSSAGNNASVINFPPGFQASHAIAVNDTYGAIFSIPAAGVLGNNALVYEGSGPSSGNAGNFTGGSSSFSLNFQWSDIGMTGASTENLDFVIVLMSNDGYLSNEGYGGGFDSGTADAGNNYGSQNLTTTQYLRYTPGSAIARLGGVAETITGNTTPLLWTSSATWVNGNPPFLEDQISIRTDVIADTNVSTTELSFVSSGGSTPALTVNQGTTLTSTGSLSVDENFIVDGALRLESSTINGDIIIGETGMLDVRTGTNTINNKVSMQAGFNGAAQIEEVQGVLVQNGSFSIEKFFPVATNDNNTSPGTRAYRFISPSVTTTSSIQDNWQNDQDGNASTIASGVGTHITGQGGTANGFDVTASNSPSLFTFDNSNVPSTPSDQNQSWQSVPDTFGTLEAGTPYRIFIRGDRNYDLTSSPANPPNSDVRLVTEGGITVGPDTQNVVPAAGYFGMVGNPYQAIVDMATVNYTNVLQNFIYAWDPNIGDFGQYVAVDLSLGTSSPGSSDANKFLMPGQAVFVETNASAPASVTFNETSKAVNEAFTSVFSTPSPESKLDVRLYTENRYNAGLTESASFGLRFDGSFDNALNNSDASLLEGPAENIYTSNGSKAYSIEMRNIPSNNETIQLFTEGYTSNDNILYLNRENLTLGNIDAILVDNFLNTRTTIQDGVNTYSFSIDPANAASFDIDRFSIVFSDGTLSSNSLLKTNVLIFPNPSNGTFSIEVPGIQDEKLVTIFNSLGQQVMQFVSTETRISVQNKGLDSGIYLVNIAAGSDQITKKLIIK